MLQTLLAAVSRQDFEECTISLVPYQDRCHYITKHCLGSWQYVPNKLYYCGSGNDIARHLALIAGLFTVLALCLSLLSVLVSQYFYPHLDKLATGYLRIDCRTVTFTLIPLMNALPDLINYHFTLSSDPGDIQLILGTICGSILILLSVVIGLIAVISPSPIPISRNLYIAFNWCFVVFASFTVILSDGVITMGECYVLVVLYVCYVAYLVGFDYKNVNEYETEPYNVLEIIEEDVRERRSRESTPLLTEQNSGSHTEECEDDDECQNKEDQGRSLLDIGLGSFMGFLAAIIPLSQLTTSWIVYFWYFESALIVYYEGVTLPIAFVLLLILIALDWTVPHSRNLLQIVTGTAISLFFISKLSFIALVVIRNLGMILPISNFLLGFLIFSIGSSLGDIITNLTISLRININYGINASLGSPLLLILLGLGVNGLVTMYHLRVSHLDFEVNYNIVVLVATLLIISSIYLIYIPLNNWVLDRKLGALMLSIYVGLVFVVAIVEDA